MLLNHAPASHTNVAQVLHLAPLAAPILYYYSTTHLFHILMLLDHAPASHTNVAQVLHLAPLAAPILDVNGKVVR